MAGRRAVSGSIAAAVVVGLVALLLLPPAPTVHATARSDSLVAASPTAPQALREGPALEVSSSLRSAHADEGIKSGAAPVRGEAPPGLIPERPATIVNPLQFYAREPAPMGIADFGVTGPGSGASAYGYFSPSFEGQATVRSMSVSISGSSSKVTAFELNAVLFLQRDGVNYSYWIQNGLHLDAASDLFSIGGAYVWNFSSPTARLSSGELQGDSRSVLVSDTYYFIPNCAASFPNQCTGLSLPASLSGRVVSSTSGVTPYVDFEYNVGSGWVTYDNVSFLHMAGASDAGFRVDGFAPTPISAGLYYDAEWDWVGAGGGSASVDQASDIDMSLELWNGHNYQAVPMAWNFGSNTGETSSNVSDLRASTSRAEPAAHLASGPGTLGVLYNRSNVGFLNLTIPALGPETLVVDGGSVPFQGRWANLTLLAGPHSLYLENYTNSSDQFDIAGGATTFVNLSGAGRVVFTESGLPVGTSWGLSIGSTSLSTTQTSLVWNLPNGTYSVSYLGVSGYYQVGSSPPALTVPGATQFDLVFAQFTYSVTFTESGLPGSTPWWVDANGTVVEGTEPTLHVSAPNGSTPYEVGSSYEFVADPANGTIFVVGGRSGGATVDFSYRPTFVAGIVSPADAQVTVGGVLQTLDRGAFSDPVFAGTFLVVANATGFVGQSMSVTATPGNITWVNVTLVRAANQTGPPPAESSGISGSTETALVVAVGVIALATVALLLLRRRRG